MARTFETIEQFKGIQNELIDKSGFKCEPICFSSSDEWSVREGVIERPDGNFFSITGLQGRSSGDVLPVTQSPIVYQPTNAINGFLFCRDGDELQILFQARLEPGNIGGVQLAPTVQSTEANYRQVHGGKPTSYIDSFLGASNGSCLYKGLQSEEGSRYHGKYNLYSIIETDDGELAAEKDDFYLLGARQLKELVSLDYVINTDARGLLFFLDWDLLAGGDGAFQAVDDPINRALARSYCHDGEVAGTRVDEAVRRIMHMRAKSAIRAWHIPIDSLDNWILDDEILREREEQLGFSIRLFGVTAGHREVPRWDQPLVSSDTEGNVVLLCRINNGIMEFLVSMDFEIGYLEGVQYTASASVPPGKREHLFTDGERRILDLADSAEASAVLVDCRQSEEGGRFFQDVNRYRIVVVDEDIAAPPESNSLWLTLSQIKALGEISSMLSIELRCTLALLIERV